MKHWTMVSTCTRPLSNDTMIGSKSFGSRTVAIKLVPQEEAVEAVTDLIILTGSKKDQVPNGYKRLPYVIINRMIRLISFYYREINGFSICFQLTKMNKAPQARAAAPVTNRPRSGASIGTDNTVLYERQVSKKARSGNSNSINYFIVEMM